MKFVKIIKYYSILLNRVLSHASRAVPLCGNSPIPRKGRRRYCILRLQQFQRSSVGTRSCNNQARSPLRESVALEPIWQSFISFHLIIQCCHFAMNFGDHKTIIHTQQQAAIQPSTIRFVAISSLSVCIAQKRSLCTYGIRLYHSVAMI